MKLIELVKNSDLSIYKLVSYNGITRLIVSTPETKRICNDPFIVGLEYTEALKRACAKALIGLRNINEIDLVEEQTSVLHILRGGINFGLREALGQAFNWNRHASNFISAQRARKSADSEDWIITENSYNKFHLKKVNQIVFGDVVATGTSLEYALEKVMDNAESCKAEIKSLLFFSIGGARSHEILSKLVQKIKILCPNFQSATVIYFEGIFGVADNDSPMPISITGTDLLRSPAILAPEFIESQYSNPSYPIERCTIYDAGSRAFDLDQYFFDVKDYWTQTLSLASEGMTYEHLLKQRFPKLDFSRFATPNLAKICANQISKIPIHNNCLSVLSEH